MAKRAAVEIDAIPVGPAVALCDQMEVAKQQLFTVARSGELDAPVPDVLARTLVGDGDVLLVSWRAWDIYAARSSDGWIIRADMVR